VINKGTATIHEPPREVIGDLLYEQNRTKNIGNNGSTAVGGNGQPISCIGCHGVGGTSSIVAPASPSSPIQVPRNKTDQQLLSAYMK
jgi:hypothetical protein